MQPISHNCYNFRFSIGYEKPFPISLNFIVKTLIIFQITCPSNFNISKEMKNIILNRAGGINCRYSTIDEGSIFQSLAWSVWHKSQYTFVFTIENISTAEIFSEFSKNYALDRMEVLIFQQFELWTCSVLFELTFIGPQAISSLLGARLIYPTIPVYIR